MSHYDHYTVLYILYHFPDEGQDSLSETNAKQENQADLHENPGLVGFAGPE